jgi:hypothetical protein
MLGGCSGSMTSSSNPQNPSAPVTPGTPGTSSSTTVAAYVYVANQTGSTASSADQIVAYSAAANGQLTPLTGSPFDDNLYSIAVNGSYLVGAAAGPYLNTYKIGADGSLTQATQYDYTQDVGYQSNNDTTCSGMGGLFFDHSGQSLYAEVNNIQCSNNNAVASYAVDGTSGSLSYLGNTNIGYESSADIALLGNNAFGYSALDDACMYGGIFSFARSSSGLLSGFVSTNTPPHGPPAPPGSTGGIVEPSYAAGLTATDSTNHVAMVEYPCYAQNGVAAQQVQLAAWTADASGNLSTSDTYATMPGTEVSTPQDMKISPDGTLVAVGGIGGLQVFHFNGANSITAYTDLLTTDSISQMFWDNQNHLYAISLTGGAYGASSVSPGKLYVFSVPAAGGSATPQQAPGSPYTVSTPIALAVQAK